jgi:hypothetical protein
LRVEEMAADIRIIAMYHGCTSRDMNFIGGNDGAYTTFLFYHKFGTSST